MTEFDEFEALMRQLGVKPLRKGTQTRVRRVTPAGSAATADAESGVLVPDPPTETEARVAAPVDPDEAAFLAAMATIESVPDKDSPPPAPPAPPRARGPSRLRLRTRRDLRIDATVDLHGATRESGRRTLERFVQNAWLRGHDTIKVITGKGHHSETGEAVLRDMAERWIHGPGSRFVAAWSAAPRREGGSGAMILKLRAR